MRALKGDALDPKGLIAEAYKIDGITAVECRSIFLDWALNLEGKSAVALTALLERHGNDAHPMTQVLHEGLSASVKSKRRGGWRSRKRPVTVLLEKGRYRARETDAPADILKAQALRRRAFGCDDRDGLDGQCRHILVEGTAGSEVLCCYRMLSLRGADIAQSYSAQFYDLSRLTGFSGQMVEMGRFCTDPDYAGDPDLLRLAWGAMTRFVDVQHVELLFGCSSFSGTEALRYLDSFALLNARYRAPEEWSPKVKSSTIFCFDDLADHEISHGQATRAIPPLLRTYLSMGGWVSDHAVIDAQMDTLHVFTGVEISAIPAARKRLLRSVAG